MRKTSSTTITLLITLGFLAFMPEAIKAGQSGINAPEQCFNRGSDSFDKKKYCEGHFGPYESTCCPPPRCNSGFVPPLPSTCSEYQPSAAGTTDFPGWDISDSSQTAKPEAAHPETTFRRTSAALLTLLVLFGGLGGIALLTRKLLHPASDSRARHRHHNRRVLSPLRTIGFASLITAIGVGAGAWLLTEGTWLSTRNAQAAPVSPLVTGQPQVRTTAAEPNFSSAFQIGGRGITQIGGIATDPQGNTYVAGGFIGNITFNTAPQATTLNSTENYDVFIAKYDSAGQPLWARMANGATGLSVTDPGTQVDDQFSRDGALALAIDVQGAAYVGGGFVKSLFFKDASGATIATLGDDVEAESDEINFELFVAKYDANGTLVWAQGGNSGALNDPEAEIDLDSGINGITDIAVDNLGNPYVAGTFTGDNFLGQEVTTEGGRDVLLSRLNPLTGAPLWVSTPGSVNTDAATGLAIDDNSNVYIIGDMDGTITFPTQPEPTTLTLEDEFGDAFIAKYDTNGQVLYAKQIGGTQPIDGSHIAVTGAGEMYLTGAFEGTAEFDSITVTDPSEGSGASGFLTKYNASGTAIWARTFGRAAGEGTSEGDVLGYRVAVDRTGAPYVAGIFEGGATFGSESPATTRTLASDKLEDQFVAHYDAAGNFRWVKRGTEGSIGFRSEDAPVDIPPMRLVYNDAANAMLLTGDFDGTLMLDDITLNSGEDRRSFVAALPVNINPTAADIQIAGIVNRVNGTPIGGATLTLSGSTQATATTGSDGRYSFTVPANGVYQLTVAARGVRFSPAQQTFGSTAANQTADFTALPVKGRAVLRSRSK